MSKTGRKISVLEKKGEEEIQMNELFLKKGRIHHFHEDFMLLIHEISKLGCILEIMES